MKACALAAALDGRVIGAADAEISRAVHPGEASCDGDVAIAVSPGNMLDSPWAVAHGSRPPTPVSWGCGPRRDGFLAGSGLRPHD